MTCVFRRRDVALYTKNQNRKLISTSAWMTKRIHLGNIILEFKKKKKLISKFPTKGMSVSMNVNDVHFTTSKKSIIQGDVIVINRIFGLHFQHMKNSNWILMSCQLHRVTSGQSYSVISKCTFQNSSSYWAIQAGLLTPLTFARHRLSPLAAFTSGAYFLHNGRW